MTWVQQKQGQSPQFVHLATSILATGAIPCEDKTPMPWRPSKRTQLTQLPTPRRNASWSKLRTPAPDPIRAHTHSVQASLHRLRCASVSVQVSLCKLLCASRSVHCATNVRSSLSCFSPTYYLQIPVFQHDASLNGKLLEC